MSESTRISFRYRSIPQLSDFSELMEMLFPGNRNQQHAAACIFVELKWSHHIVPSMAYMESKYDISRRILQRTRAKLAKLGLIEHVSYLNSRYGGEQGWKLSSRFETGLRGLAAKCGQLRDVNTGSMEKDLMLVDFAASRRGLAGGGPKKRQKGDNGW
ncbi:MAG: hypothetical protein IH624_17000 [Phycisphaerae bacterium]|nr:hypothetical protein [Phycisphaerae bacterium]